MSSWIQINKRFFMNPFIPCPFTYGDIPGGGVPSVIVVANTAPTVSQNQQQPGTFWLNPEPTGSGNLYYLAGFVGGVPQWELIGTATGSIVGVVGTSPVTVSVVGGVATISIISSPSFGGTTTSATGFTATSGNFTATTGNLVLNGAGSKLLINAATPASASVGTTAAMIAGAVTITSSAITAASKIIYARATLGTVGGNVAISAQSVGSATLTSDASTETSTFNYLIIN